MRKNTILIIEDNLVWLESYKKWLGPSYVFSNAIAADEAFQKFEDSIPDLVILDLGLPDFESGFDVLDKIIASGSDVAVIVITSSKDHKHALEAQKRGADAYFFKGENIKDELPLLVRRALKMQALERENKKLRQKLDKVFSFDNIVAISKPMHNILELIEKVKDSTESILIMGESGVGKEVVAQHIHGRSRYKNKSFIPINCGAMPENLLENELFGHERGAFTGATNLKKGKIEIADGGTLFLDEIGDLPLSLQVKLLRVLQEKKFFRLGGSEEISSNFRLIAASNKNLSEEVKNKNFREDLFYRLNVIPIHVPPLRERPDDIPALIEFFTLKYCRENNIRQPRIEPNLISYMSKLYWEGNIRQLENTLKRMLVLSSKTLVLHDLPEEVKRNDNSFLHAGLIHHHTLDDISKQYAKMVLNHVGGNKKEACKILEINYRTLQAKTKE
jgi:DNA-binding NtrC family response regulator